MLYIQHTHCESAAVIFVCLNSAGNTKERCDVTGVAKSHLCSSSACWGLIRLYPSEAKLSVKRIKCIAVQSQRLGH